MTYTDQIKSPKWQKKRLELLNLHNYTCQNCNDTESQLHVHHRFYKKGLKIWEYDSEELSVLCEDCHKKTHELSDEINAFLANIEAAFDIETKEQIIGYLHGLIGPAFKETPSDAYKQGYVDARSSSSVPFEFRFKALSWRN